MSHYDCKECHHDPVSGHAPDCTRTKAMDELIAGDADLYEALDTAIELIQGAKGLADGPAGGDITNHLDFAESWIDKAIAQGSPDKAEIERLTNCLVKANAGFEEYERRYLLGCDDIERLTAENARLRTVLQWIADTAYVHHQSGNENFEHLQSIARDALSWGEPT